MPPGSSLGSEPWSARPWAQRQLRGRIMLGGEERIARAARPPLRARRASAARDGIARRPAMAHVACRRDLRGRRGSCCSAPRFWIVLGLQELTGSAAPDAGAGRGPAGRAASAAAPRSPSTGARATPPPSRVLAMCCRCARPGGRLRRPPLAVSRLSGAGESRSGQASAQTRRNGETATGVGSALRSDPDLALAVEPDRSRSRGLPASRARLPPASAPPAA